MQIHSAFLFLVAMGLALPASHAIGKDSDFHVDDFVRSTSKKQLDERFGLEAYQEVYVSVGEGECSKGAVYLKGSDREFKVIWADDHKKLVSSVHFIGKKWQTRAGLRLGTSLREIEKINGFPFQLAGFDWDYGGTVYGFGKRGKLDKGNMVIRLDGGRSSAGAQTAARKVQGDRSYSSGHPAMQFLNPNIVYLGLHFGYTKQTSIMCPSSEN